MALGHSNTEGLVLSLASWVAYATLMVSWRVNVRCRRVAELRYIVPLPPGSLLSYHLRVDVLDGLD